MRDHPASAGTAGLRRFCVVELEQCTQAVAMGAQQVARAFGVWTRVPGLAKIHQSVLQRGSMRNPKVLSSAEPGRHARCNAVQSSQHVRRPRIVWMTLGSAVEPRIERQCETL